MLVKKRSWPRRHAKLASLAAVIILAAALLAVIAHSLSSPASGNISRQGDAGGPKISICSSNCSSKPETDTFEGQYVRFTYSNDYSNLRSNKNNSLESAYLIGSTHAKSLALNVVRETLANDSGVTFRRMHPDIYKEEDTAKAVIFTKDNQEGSEHTAYLTHNDLVASVSLTSPYSGVDLSPDYQTIAQSWQWK